MTPTPQALRAHRGRRSWLRPTAALATVAALLLGGAACGSPPSATPPVSQSASTPDAYPVTVGTLTLPEQPKRIVSLSPTTTETIFAVGAGPQVVAVDKLSNHPAEAPKSDLDAYKPSAEAIAKQDPDLVVLSYDIDKIVSQLAALKIPVYFAAPATNLDDVYQQIIDLGTLTGHRQAGIDLAQRMKGDVATLSQGLPKRTKKLTYYYELSPDYYSVTSRTFIGSLFAQAGLVNIADATAKANSYPQLSAEVIVQVNPDLIFLADTKCCGQSAQTVAARPGWNKITAVTKQQVVGLDDDIASRWGPRVVDLFRQITSAVSEVPA